MNVSRRSALRSDDRGSLPMAMLAAMIGLSVVVLLLPIVVMRINSTGWEHSRAREVAAAEAGIDVAAGLVRSAVDASTGAGVAAKLPCAPAAAPLTGTVAGVNGLSYSTVIGYYTQNPLGQSADWLAPSTGASDTVHQGMLCASGFGTKFPPTGELVPSYVMISATGKDGRASRTLRATYFVQTSNANVAGGTIYVFPSSTSTFCLDAGSSVPVAGTRVKVQPCLKPTDQKQAWAYNTDLSIRLVSSKTSTYPNGLCLTSPTTAGSTNYVTLTECVPSGHAPNYLQSWSVNDSSHLEGATSNLSGTSGNCLNLASQTAGTLVNLLACAGGVTDTKQTWVPSPDVGAGMAGPGQDQVVNFQQFGRCLDDTNWDVNIPYLIAYTCKQNPDPGQVGMNQKFTFVPEGTNGNGQVGRWVMTDKATGGKYCLVSPLSAYSATRPGPYVTLDPCPAGATPPEMKWTQYPGTDSEGNPLGPLEKYTVKDAGNLCLSLTVGTADVYNGQYSKVIVEACNGSTLQKWNANPDVRTPLLTDLRELASPTQGG